MVQDTDNNLEDNADKIKSDGISVNAGDIAIAIESLKTYMDEDSISPLLSALETLKTEPLKASYQTRVIAAFDEIGILQGAALTYAPYLIIFLSDDPFGEK